MLPYRYDRERPGANERLIPGLIRSLHPHHTPEQSSPVVYPERTELEVCILSSLTHSYGSEKAGLFRFSGLAFLAFLAFSVYNSHYRLFPPKKARLFWAFSAFSGFFGFFVLG